MDVGNTRSQDFLGERIAFYVLKQMNTSRAVSGLIE